MPALADELHLKDGRVIEAEEVWESGGIVWYRQGKLIASVPRNEVVRITKPIPEEAQKTDKPATKAKSKDSASPAEERKDAKDAPASHKVTRIVLKDGTRIDADSIWEESERLGYRLGKMQTVIDRSEVANVFHNVEVKEDAPLPGEVKLRFSTGNRSLDGLIVYSATRHGVDPLLIYLVMREESGFNYRAVSRVGARGLMQLMPETAARLGVRNIHDPVENVEAGTRYLRGLIDLFGGDINLALAAYNAGEGAVLKYGRRIPPYNETMNYVWRINTAYRRAIGQ
ncbi:MAG TPA: lytic transglycosylase domain-containing protein [Blastocatellia bacterium]|nr:lytic transglycosylase domain-containing protein [Blastocatellia bacterium]HMZ17176.1 lytic transglycosylase domain-containing protein [Blastocatellia bacterium]HNG31869.1 lytic transglycosylase domain-containing protein [Blastocatellia bacterium]